MYSSSTGCFPFVVLAIVLSVAELNLLVEASAHIGFMGTVLLCILTAGVGGNLVRIQGFKTLGTIQQKSAQGEVLTDELIGGLLLVIVGVLLMVPGFITDAFGFFIILPGGRALTVKMLKKRFKNVALHGAVNFGNMGGMGNDPFGQSPFSHGQQRQPEYDTDTKTYTTTDYEEDPVDPATGSDTINKTRKIESEP